MSTPAPLLTPRRKLMLMALAAGIAIFASMHLLSWWSAGEYSYSIGRGSWCRGVCRSLPYGTGMRSWFGLGIAYVAAVGCLVMAALTAWPNLAQRWDQLEHAGQGVMLAGGVATLRFFYELFFNTPPAYFKAAARIAGAGNGHLGAGGIVGIAAAALAAYVGYRYAGLDEDEAAARNAAERPTVVSVPLPGTVLDEPPAPVPVRRVPKHVEPIELDLGPEPNAAAHGEPDPFAPPLERRR